MQNESQNIEYKESWRDEYLKWICGFANAQGGTIYIGVNDQKEVIGVSDSKRLMEDIPNKVRDVLGIVVDVNELKEGNKEYIEIVVPAYPNPINYKGQYHYRSGSTKQELRGAALNRFLQERSGLRWDEYPIAGVAIDDLSKEALVRFRQRAARSHRVDAEVLNDTDETLLSNLLLIDDSKRLRRATVLLFHPQPEHFVLGSYVKIGFFNGDDDELAFQDEIHGPLMLQVDKVMELLTTKYLYYAISYDGNHRVEKLPYPEEALREMVLNALAHKDYTSSLPIQISVYPDHLVFWNPGQLPLDWSVERLFEKHPSQAFNPTVANAFFRSGDIEAWGRGYRRIAKFTREASLLPPIVKVDNGLMITYFSHVKDQLSAMGLDDRQSKVIEYVVDHGQITNANVQQMFKVSRVTALRILTSLNTILTLKGGKGTDSHYVMMVP